MHYYIVNKIKKNIQIIIYIFLIIVLLTALLLTNQFMNIGIKTQSKYIDYLVILDSYEKMSDEHISHAIKYIKFEDQNSLVIYEYLYNNKELEKITNELYKLGVTEQEDKLIKEIIKINEDLRKLEKTDMEDQTVSMGVASVRTVLSTPIFSVHYLNLSQQHKALTNELRESITTRMSISVSNNTDYLNKGFLLMTIIACFVPLLLLCHFNRSQKLNKRINLEKELQTATLKNIADGVVVVGLKGNIILFNPAAEKITGYSYSQAMGKNINEIVKFDNDSNFIGNCRYNEYKAETSCPLSIQIDKPLKLITQFEEEKIVALTCAKIYKDKQVQGVVFTIRDETEKLRLQEEVEKTKRLESLGLLGGGIAHDFNNTLTVIIGNIGLAKLYEYQGNPQLISNCLTEIEKETNRAQHITKQILTFAKGGLPIKKIENMYSIVKNSADEVLKGTSIKYAIKAPLEEIKVEVDHGQMSEALKNIFTNSRESIINNGKVSADIQQICDNQENKLVEITIKDNGVGISEENLHKIYDPYYTTKEDSQGLGLPTTYSIIKNHNGKIDACTKNGETLFTITLPVAFPITEDDQIITTPTDPIKSVLIMDDEERIINVITRYLKENKYKVESARSGQEAIKKYKTKLEEGDPYNLLILDLNIPNGMGGKETISQILKIDPTAKAIVSSGYSDDCVMANHKKHGFTEILPKPYKPEDLVKLIKKM